MNGVLNRNLMLAIFLGSIFILGLTFVGSVSAASNNLGQGTKYYDQYEDKLVWKAYTKGPSVVVYITEYEKRGGRWFFDNKERTNITKTSKTKAKISKYEYDDKDADIYYKSTKLSAKSYFLKVFKANLLRSYY